MRIIPVIDLKGGLVVRARGGDRAAYRPIVTPLSPSAEPEAVISGFLGVAPFDTAYIADLDVIERGAPQAETIAALARTFPHLCFWVDMGARRALDLDWMAGHGALRPVLGSETLQDLSLLGLKSAVLSLDFKNGALLGSAEIFENTSLWPGDIIVMSLDSVGARRGPDFARLTEIKRIAAGKRLYAAGGTRSLSDLQQLQTAKVHGTLVATALHDGALNRENLAALMESGK
jgi:phosphoribosylformimino-5-aminoimidazole carboxamide ribotide isomerase